MELQEKLDYIKETLVMIKKDRPESLPATIDAKGRAISVKCGDFVTLTVNRPGTLVPMLIAHIIGDCEFFITINHNKEVDEVMEYVKGYCDDYRRRNNQERSAHKYSSIRRCVSLVS
jgi:hypothetical protein